MKIIISGSIAYDRIMDFPGKFEDHILPSEIHKLNVSFMVKEFKESFGGAAGNIAYNLALLEERPVLHSAVGSDFEKYGKRLEDLKIDLSGIKKYQKTLTASAYIITDENDNQITGFFPGAMMFYSQRPKTLKNDLAIIAPGNPNEMLDLADQYFKAQTPFIFDPGQQIIQFTKNQLRKLVKQSVIFIVNDYELELTKKITGLDHGSILSLAGILISTLGSQGSVIEIQSEKKLERVNVTPAKVSATKDPTGAGDALRAGIIKGILNSKLKLIPKNYFIFPWLLIGQMGNLAGAYAVEKYGTQNHNYTYNQFKKRYQTNYNQTL